MPDGLCDWKDCACDVGLRPLTVRIHDHDDARHTDPHSGEWRFELCPPHATALTSFIQESPLHLAPLDEGLV